MDHAIYNTLEQAIYGRNPLLIKKLKLGLPEKKVRQILVNAKISGNIDCLVDLYTWKNGTVLDQQVLREKNGIFPGPVFHFLDLEMAIADFGFLKEAAVNHPKLIEAVGRYFPILWDGSQKNMAVDLLVSEKNRIVIVDCNAERPFKYGYATFAEFIHDLIRANQENDNLVCFKGT